MLKLILKSKKNQHFSEAIMMDGVITILKGAKINPILSFPSMSHKIISLRTDEKIVDKNGKLLLNMTFNSPTQAAQFVTGRSVNGYVAWRVNDTISLKSYRTLSASEKEKYECQL